MAKYKGEERADGVLVVKRTLSKLTEENARLASDLDYITKEEIITAIKKIAAEVGVQVEFTYENKKNNLGP